MIDTGVNNTNQYSQQSESQRTADPTIVLNKQMLGLVIDTLMIQLISTQETQRTNHFFIDAGRPTLQGLGQIRVALETMMKGQEAELDEAYGALVALLPQTMQQELAKPPGERDPRYTALDNVLHLAADIMVWANQIQPMSQLEGVQSETMQLFQLMPYVALIGALDNSGELATITASLLSEFNNSPEASGWQDRLLGFNEIVTDAKELIGRIVSGQAEPGDIESLHGLAQRIELFLSTSSPGGGGAVLDAQMKALLFVVESFRSPLEAGPSALLGLLVASSGVGNGGDGDPLGALGPLFALLGAGMGSGSDPGAQQLTGALLTLGVLAVAVSCAALSNGELGPAPDAEQADPKFFHQLEGSMVLSTLMQSGVLDQLFTHFAGAAGVSKEGELHKSELKLGMMLLVAGLMGGNDTGTQADVLAGVEKKFANCLAHVADVWSERAVDDPSAALVAAALQQGAALAGNGDIKGALDVVWGAFEHVGNPQEEIANGLSSLRNMAQMLLLALSLGAHEGDSRSTEVLTTA